MSDIVLVALIATITPTVVGITSIVVSLINRSKIRQVHDLVNSGFDEAKRDAKALGKAEGKEEGRVQGRDEEKTKND